MCLLACLLDTGRGSIAVGEAALDAVGCRAVLIAHGEFGAVCWYVARAVALAAPDARVVFRSVHSRNGFSEPHRTDYAPLWRIVGAAGSADHSVFCVASACTCGQSDCGGRRGPVRMVGFGFGGAVRLCRGVQRFSLAAIRFAISRRRTE